MLPAYADALKEEFEKGELNFNSLMRILYSNRNFYKNKVLVT